MQDVAISAATEEDKSAVADLLAQSNLPSEDIEEHLSQFLVARKNGRIVGTIGIEVYGISGLLRSLAVDQSFRSQGLGKALCEDLVGYALSRGVKELSLLTTTAETFFARIGFQKVASDKIPAYVKETKEYKVFCPSSAVCMVKKIDG